MSDCSRINVRRYAEEYIVSTDQDIIEKVRNYTFTKSYWHVGFDYIKFEGNSETFYSYSYANFIGDHIEYSLQINNTIISGNVDSILNLNQINEALMITFEEGFSTPTYIKQTEPSDIIGLGLNQEDYEIKEYFLVRDEEISTETISSVEISSKSDSIYPFFVMIVILPLIAKKFR